LLLEATLLNTNMAKVGLGKGVGQITSLVSGVIMLMWGGEGN